MRVLQYVDFTLFIGDDSFISVRGKQPLYRVENILIAVSLRNPSVFRGGEYSAPTVNVNAVLCLNLTLMRPTVGDNERKPFECLV